ncbi:DIRAS1 [Cordylochernes scorpioides]|uniref:DIRAS1 n=1 Tax=Cordylochernes scorpioides TaxID=51811 RepID=A0ABY6KX87_9ARAC|nr:DIRAS1 [Cordylochernes scorpioides]
MRLLLGAVHFGEDHILSLDMLVFLAGASLAQERKTYNDFRPTVYGRGRVVRAKVAAANGTAGHAAVGGPSVKENKLVVLGAGGVGKTSLVVQFLEGFFSTSYKPTVEDYYQHTIQLPGRPAYRETRCDLHQSSGSKKKPHYSDHAKSWTKKGCIQAPGIPSNSSRPRATPRPSKVQECQTTR